MAIARLARGVVACLVMALAAPAHARPDDAALHEQARKLMSSAADQVVDIQQEPDNSARVLFRPFVGEPSVCEFPEITVHMERLGADKAYHEAGVQSGEAVYRIVRDSSGHLPSDEQLTRRLCNSGPFSTRYIQSPDPRIVLAAARLLDEFGQKLRDHDPAAISRLCTGANECLPVSSASDLMFTNNLVAAWVGECDRANRPSCLKMTLMPDGYSGKVYFVETEYTGDYRAATGAGIYIWLRPGIVPRQVSP